MLHLSKTISNKLEAKKEIRIIKVYIFLKICLGLYPNKIATQNRDREKESESEITRVKLANAALPVVGLMPNSWLGSSLTRGSVRFY